MERFLSEIYATVPLDIERRLVSHYKNIILNDGLFNRYLNFHSSSLQNEKKQLPKIGVLGLNSLSEDSIQRKNTKDFLIKINTTIEKDIHGFMDKLFMESHALPIFHKIYNQIKNRIETTDEEYVPISNIRYCYTHNHTGRNYKFCCPFHEEKTPSFRYSFSEKKFYCFGCAFNMNVFGLTATVLGISVVEAVYILCKIYNIPPDVFRYPKMKYPLSIWKHIL